MHATENMAVSEQLRVNILFFHRLGYMPFRVWTMSLLPAGSENEVPS